MFKKLLISITCATALMSVNAQTQEDRNKIISTYDQKEIKALQKKLDAENVENQIRIQNYLKKNKLARNSFEKEGVIYKLHKIDKNGNPVYIKSKNRESSTLIKADKMYPNASLGLSITGTNMVAGIWDLGRVRTTHELLLNKTTWMQNQTVMGFNKTYSGANHQTHVTGTMIGKELQSNLSVRGIAFDATSRNYDTENDNAEMLTFGNDGFLISNHSYGYANDNTTPVWTYGAYDEEAKNIDAMLKTTPFYLPFFAGGNEQTSSGNPTKNGFDIITGGSASKNVMTVGAVDGDRAMSNYSNWGPMDDGRIKPDICAKGTGINSAQYSDAAGDTSNTAIYSGNGVASSGTSYASLAVAAGGLLLQQYYKSLYGSYMKAALLKALLLHSADDEGLSGPDAKFGWGIANIESAANIIKNKAMGTVVLDVITTNPINNSVDELYKDLILKGNENARASICWTDDEGPEQKEQDGIDIITSRLVYNFEIALMETSSTTVTSHVWKGPKMDNPSASASVSGNWFENNVDNYKQANINLPTPNAKGKLLIRKSSSSPSIIKEFAIVVTGITSAGTITSAVTITSPNLNSTTGTNYNYSKENKPTPIVFFSATDSKLKLISNTVDKIGDYDILDLNGKIVQEGNSNQKEILVQTLTPGVYIVRFYTNREQVKMKFIIY